MKSTALVLWFCLCGMSGLFAQGTFVYDQESSTDEAYPIGGPRIQLYSSFGQSFTPSLSTIGFVRFKTDDVTPGNALGATLFINLRSQSMTGTILGSTAPVTLNDGFAGSVNFYFASVLSVVPSSTYFFEAVVQSGDNWGITTLGDSYAGGSVYANGFPATGNDVWFREGIIVPEPAAVALLACGCVVWFGHRNRRVRM